MNFFDAEVSGNRATLPDGTMIALGADYAPISGQIGIRPEYVGLTDEGGLPLTIHRIEDVGRHRLIRGEVLGKPLNVVVPEGQAVAALPRVAFAPDKINIYANEWRVAPRGPAERAA